MILPNTHHENVVFIKALVFPMFGFRPSISICIAFCDTNVKHAFELGLVANVLIEFLRVFAVFRVVAWGIGHELMS